MCAALAVSLTLAGCAGYSPGRLEPGTPVAAVLERMGKPTGEHRLEGGQRRLEFARGPAGKHTYMIDVDSEGRVLRWEQVLTEANFLALPSGLSREELRQRLGRPSEEMSIPRRNERIWSYRYENPFCLWFQVAIDRATDRVTSAGHGPDPACPVRDDLIDFSP